MGHRVCQFTCALHGLWDKPNIDTIYSPLYCLLTGKARCEAPFPTAERDSQWFGALHAHLSVLSNGMFPMDVLQDFRSLGETAIRELADDVKLAFVGNFCTANDLDVRTLIRQTTLRVAAAVGR